MFSLNPVTTFVNSLKAKILTPGHVAFLQHIAPAVGKFVASINWSKAAEDFISNYAIDHNASKDAIIALGPVLIEAEAELKAELPAIEKELGI